MSVLINMEMPTLYRTYKVRFSESDDGKIIVGIANEDSTAYRPIGEVIPVPPHGDLIDASTKVTVQTYDDMYEEYRDVECTIAYALDRWSDEGCPEAIIPADKDSAK